MKNIAIVQGGKGPEKEISYKTSLSLQKALDNIGCSYSVLEADNNLSQSLLSQKITKVILAVHGQYAEDGTLQGLLEYLQIPYTGAGVLASSVCMDKVVFKKIVQSLNILTPSYCQITKETLSLAKPFLKKHGLPLVVKPSRGGSSVATFIVNSEAEFLVAIKKALEIDSQVLVEEYIEGKDVTIPFFANHFLSPIEISIKEGFYDYKNKYTSGNTSYKILEKPNNDTLSSELLSPELRNNLCYLAKAQNSLKEVIQFLNIRHYGRADFMLSKDGKIYMLEVNTLPGFTNASLITKSAQKEGISIEDMLSFLLKNASLDYLQV